MPELNKKLDLYATAHVGRRGARWRWTAGALITAVAAAAVACESRPPDQWIGLDRAAVSCSTATDDPQRATCVGERRIYTCVRDWGQYTWRCAEQRPAVALPPAVERAP